MNNANLSSVKTGGTQSKKPNILVIFGDDIGYWNLSCYNSGMMGYKTPNIDRLAREGARFTDYYAQQSCTAGRAAFITGQCPVRTGLTKVGLPGADLGLQIQDPTIAELIKPLGYKTAQFGKNHLGDRDEFLPTMHGFDEFFGNLYHLNAEEEPENEDYPKDPNFRESFGPRGVLDCKANPDGTQTIVDTGPLTRKRMETIDEEILARACGFLDREKDSDAPFFMWFNTTRMHIFTHVKEEHRGRSGLGEYWDGMMEHDEIVGKLLDKIDALGLREDTIVVYTTDNGAMVCTWPDASTTPFRGEKDTNWEGAFRVPCLVRWPGVVEPGRIINDIFASEDWLPTFLAAAGDADVVTRLKAGGKAGNKSFKVHLDGYDQRALLKGEGESARDEFFYFSDDGELLAIRYKRMKASFLLQNAKGFDVWDTAFETKRIPQIFDLRADPFERADEGIGYRRWMLDRAFLLVPIQAVVQRFMDTFKEFPPRQKAASFTVEQAFEKMQKVDSSAA